MLSFLKPKKKFILTENNKKRIEKGKIQIYLLNKIVFIRN